MVTTAIAVALGAVLIELVLRRALPLPDPYGEWKVERPAADAYVPRAYPPRFQAEIVVTGIPSLPPRGRFVTNSLGMRSPEVSLEKPPGTLRVALFGSSAIECRHLDEPLTVRARLEGLLSERRNQRVEVVFAGIWGAPTYDLLATLVHRVLHLAPDLIVAPVGLADVFAAVAGESYLRPPLGPERLRRRSPRQLAMMLASESQILRRLRRVVRPSAEPPPTFSLDATEPVAWWYRGEPTSAQRGVMRLDLDSYSENLRSIVGLAAGHGIPLLLCTQPTRLGAPHPQLPGDPWFWIKTHAYRRSEFASAIREYSDATRAVAREHAVALCDLAAEFDDRSDCFFDDSHFSAYGAEEVARVLAEQVAATLPEPEPRDALFIPRSTTLQKTT